MVHRRLWSHGRLATVLHLSTMVLAFTCAGGSLVTPAEAANPQPGGAAHALAGQCVGPAKPDPACPQTPSASDCMNPKYYLQACGLGTWKAYCACVNREQLTAAEGLGPNLVVQQKVGEVDRRPSHASGLLPKTAGPNAISVRSYGLSTDLLTTTNANTLRVQGGPISGSIGGFNAHSIGQPPHGPYLSHAGKLGKGGGKHISLALSAPPSRQNTWTAQEVYHAALSANACLGKEGEALVSCAEGIGMWPGLANHYPAFTAGLTVGSPEEFTYKRFHDVEHWTDEMAACRGDDICKAQISLDPRKGIGIVGYPVSADDPMTNATEHFLTAFVGGGGLPSCGDPNATPPVLPALSLSPPQLQVCSEIQSAPPIGFVTAGLVDSVAGGGTSGPWLTGGALFPFTGLKPPPAYLTPQQATAAGYTLINTPSQGYWMQKNAFYDAVNMITPTVLAAFASDPAKAASVQRLIAELHAGQSYYYVGKNPAGVHGAPVAKKSFPDEWAFQRAMSLANKTRGSMAGEYLDYTKRKAYVQHKAATWGLLEGELYGDLQLWAKASNAQRALARKTVVSSAVKRKPTVMGAVPNPALSNRVGSLAGLAVMSIPPTQGDKVAWGNGTAVTNPPQLDAAYRYPRLLCSAPDRLSAGYSGGVGIATTVAVGGQKASGATEARAAACNYVNAVLDEWARKDSFAVLAGADSTVGPSGCFADDPACDWNPQDLMAGLDDLVGSQLQNVQQAQREADYKVARGWWPKISNTGDPACTQLDAKGNTTGINLCAGAKASETSFLAAIRSVVNNAFTSIRQVPILDPGVGLKSGTGSAAFGENRQNGENWGSSMFGVGYDYTLKWDLPVKWQDAKVCDFGAGAQGGFEAYAYAFGSDRFDVIKTDFVAGVHDKMTGTETPDRGTIGGELVLAGDSLFSLEPPEIAALNTPLPPYPLAQGSNSETIVEIPFQISFVTLTITVGVGYTYDVTASVTPTHVNGCGTNQAPSLGLQGEIDPDGALSAIVDADVGIGPPGLADVGIEVNLTLLGIGLPVTAGVKMEMDNSLPNLVVSEGLNMDFHTLDGTLSVFADALFVQLFDIQILAWGGLHDTIPLFNANQSVPLSALTTASGSLSGPQLIGL